MSLPDDKSPSGLAALALAAAAETAEAEEPHARLPRLLRYALAAKHHRPLLPERLFREIVEIAPELKDLAQAWLEAPADHTAELAAMLDTRAVQTDSPGLTAMASCVRLLGLVDRQDLMEEHRKVAAALVATAEAAKYAMDLEMRSQIDKIIVGWALMTARIEDHVGGAASDSAYYRARNRLDRIVRATIEAERRVQEQADQDLRAAKEHERNNDSDAEERDSSEVEPGFVRVCELSEHEAKVKKVSELIAPYKHVIDVDVPLASTPDLAFVGRQLAFEFPYARHVVDALLGDLVGRDYVKLRPTLLVGEPGGGKTRFVRRVAELLGSGFWRVDATMTDGSTIGGTARRWNSVEPCHPVLAIARARFANTLILIDELEKAATRNDYGRLWDNLLGLLEVETASRYPDPALQTTVDVSHVSFLATANGVEPIPKPLRDRFRILVFPTPSAEDLQALLPPLVEAYAVERGHDSRWMAPLNGEEIDVIAANWRGGSVRRLQRFVEGVIRARDQSAARH